MIKVNVSTPFPEWPLPRQTPGQTGIWGNCQFFVNQQLEECDNKLPPKSSRGLPDSWTPLVPSMRNEQPEAVDSVANCHSGSTVIW